MTSSFDPGALMARYYLLPGGFRVCLRLARLARPAGVARLFWINGREPDELALARLLRFDPGRIVDLRHRARWTAWRRSWAWA